MESLSFFLRAQYRFRLVSFQKTRASRRNKFVEKKEEKKEENGVGTVSKYIFRPWSWNEAKNTRERWIDRLIKVIDHIIGMAKN